MSSHIDQILNQITTSNSPAALNHTLKTSLPRETREQQLSAFLANGQDPLTVLNPRTHTVGMLYILSARTYATNVPPPPFPIIEAFCENFVPEQARLAPDRVTKLAKGIQRLAAGLGNASLAIKPLYSLVTRYPPSSSYLTTIHPIFLLVCVSTRNFRFALPVLSNPVTDIDTSLSPDLHYNDNLTYHYCGGIALAALKKWKDAEEFFEICVTSPGTYPAALQMEALKKLRLVQLISTGKVTPLPRYAHPLLTRLFKNTPYQAFINAYPKNTGLLKEILDKEKSLFTQEKNLGLIQQAIDRAPRWVLRKLTATYVTLHLSDICRAVKIESEDAVRALLLSMIEDNDISAQISADGTVTFADPPAQFTKEQVDNVLKGVQDQAALLGYLELEMARSKEYLGKKVTDCGLIQSLKSIDPGWSGPGDEDIFANISGPQMWDDSVYS
ncbi:hypothetical protein CVT26_000379 [Gymnopilus dilepis]|uniref:COP9 signalosome complex subunit 3 n=1 Tax=Gymnopilus dilepis TaxID=231916 RepID=A0A409VHP0_9AGAR|nr:hypothetical protein CVT26_000379 [Gymnopilus dilepis]